MDNIALNKDQRESRLNPQLFALWLGLVSISMFFGAFTSAYIVKQGAASWLDINVPSIFYISTALIAISSYTMHQARQAFRFLNTSRYRLFLILTLVLGVAFMIMQYVGWKSLFANGVDIKTNVAGSFFYLITGAHFAHVFGGIGGLIATLSNSYILPHKTTEIRLTKVEMMAHYWHFLGLLWVYLLFFIMYI